MRPRYIYIILLGLILALTTSAIKLYSEADNAIFPALKDELDRSMKQLKTDELPGPYYILYKANESRSLGIGAGFGAITAFNEDHRRRINIDLRVGDYQFDNSNFANNMRSFEFSMGGDMSFGTSSGLPLENDYNLMRREIWLATDRAFKDAHEDFSKKRAAMENAAEERENADMTEEKPEKFSEPELEWNPDAEYWKGICRDVSAVFAEYPMIKESEVALSTSMNREYFVNSEGSEIIQNFHNARLTISASAQNEEGENFSDNRYFVADDVAGLPKREELIATAKELAQALETQSEADSISYYIGPVLFEGQAAAELWTKMVGQKLRVINEPVFADKMSSMAFDIMRTSDLTGKLDKRIMPEFIDAWDDPSATEFDGVPLHGGYNYDDEGVRGRKVELLEDGTVVGVMTNRVPFKEIENSNGHAGGLSNFFVESDKGLSLKKLRQSFIEACEEQGLKQGYIVRRVNRPLSEKDMMQSMMSRMSPMMSGGNKQDVEITPVEVYRVDIDSGDETRVSGVMLEGFGVRALRDIIAVGEDPEVFDVPDFSGNIVTAITPAVLFEEIEIKPSPTDQDKPPMLPDPLHE